MKLLKRIWKESKIVIEVVWQNKAASLVFFFVPYGIIAAGSGLMTKYLKARSEAREEMPEKPPNKTSE